MSQALAEFEVVGLSTNVAFLGRLIASQAFSAADIDTGLIERHHAQLFPAAAPAPLPVLALAVAALSLSERQPSEDPWAQTTGWRMNARLVRTLSFQEAAGECLLQVSYGREGMRLQTAQGEVLLSEIVGAGVRVKLSLNGRPTEANVVRSGDNIHVFHGGQHWTLVWNDPITHAGGHEADGGRLTAPMPGKIVALLVDAGAQVEKGAPLLIMEAMKMEHTISAPSRGKVTQLLYRVGDQVAEGAQLLSFEQEKN
jgi:3-methylcrotonyl-CoA carboxylase alpha subunit